ncbi:MAG: S-layer homology domain-containing protein [Clostridia bacterium]
MKTKHFSMKSVISMLLALVIIGGTLPVSVFAAQSNEYVDPADNWLSSNNRTNELDVNATITNETQYCNVCKKFTSVLTYRVPEYTKTGETALNRGVRYSDGTCIDGVSKGNLDNGTPGIDAYYTGYHFTKAVCQTCGTINSGDGPTDYDFNNNVYSLNSCDHNFFLDFDATTYEPYDEGRHLTTLKRGEYCKFCKGTFARASRGLESHDFTESVDAQLGNNRFYVAEKCDDCGYETSEYVTAKSVVASYYGTADGEAHTLTVSDISDSGVKTSIRYGDTADNCTKSSAPNYTQPGYYTVYYRINYSYAGETMTENGVSYVWLVNNDDSDSNDTIIAVPPAHEHDYHYLETVPPSCENLGYDRFQCNGCGNLIKTNYTPSTGHTYKAVTIREATCKQGGLKLWLCSDCGDFYEETTPLATHSYKTVKHNPTCRITGYTEHICEVCGDNYITDITPIISHAYENITKEPTCTEKGYTTHTCTMCDYHYVSDYTDALGHSWDEGHTVTNSTCEAEGVIEYHCLNDGCTEKMIKATNANGHTSGAAATCTEPQRCTVCDTVLELPTGHHYDSEVIAPTCTSMGYTFYTCRDCGDTYTGDYTDKAEHNYKKTVTAPTCTSHGYATYTCKDCGHSFVSDYTEKINHSYDKNVTAPTCTSMGYTTYVCADCGDAYKADYVDMTEHNYNKETVEPTCTEHGYAVYTCPDCGKSYIGDFTDCKEHHYTETVIAPTCTSMGYTIFKCEDCDDEYKGNYTDKIPHNYKGTITEATCTSHGYTTYSCEDCDAEYIGDYTEQANHTYEGTVTEPTCLELGFTTYVCSACGDTYKAEYKEALGHTPSDWIIDIPATINNAGEKHTECSVCGLRLMTVALPQLMGRDFSDEDGLAVVGDYSIKLYDKNNMPVWNAEVTIDVNDNVSIILPDGRLLDYADQTTIEATRTESGEAAPNLAIFIVDKNNNNATGKTDKSGILKVPNNQSSTGDNNGTIGKENDTFVVTVTDKTNVVISNCDIKIGESNNIVIDLPEGIKPTRENPVLVTVVDHNGKAQEGITIIAIGDSDFMEKGSTDMYGKITLPTASDGYTDENGKVNVDNINVIVNDEIGVISNAYVKHNEDGTINVTLPDEKTISYANRITVTVLDSVGKPVVDVNVTVSDVAEKSYTANTDENGTIVVPPLSEDMTDNEGKAVVNGYNILIEDETKPIENAFVYIKDNKIYVELPEGIIFDYNNRITATITDKDNAPVKDMSVTFTDSTDKTETNLTDENGKATVPPIYIDYTDVNGYSEVDGFVVTVTSEKGAIEKAFVTHNAEVKNENETVKTEENISIELPENSKFDYANRITVTVFNKADNTPIKDMEVIVSELPESDAEPKVLKDKTNEKGMAVYPPLSEDITDDNGDSGVTEEKPKDETGEVETTSYIVKVNDTKGIITGAFIEIKDGKVYVTLPEDKTLTTSNQTTVTVLGKDNKPVQGILVTVKDATTEKSSTTNSSGQITVPVKTSSGGGGGSSSGGSSGGGGYSISTINVKVIDKDGKAVTVSKSTGTDKITLTLPTGKDLSKDDNYYTITVTDRNGKAKADYTVVLKDKNSNELTGKTDDEGILVLPTKEHKAYIVGYNDGTFRADNDMTRAEAAAIFARLISEEKNEKIGGKSTFKDIDKNAWYADYVGYLEKYNVINGYNDGTFRSEDNVTRAEFVTMAVRYYEIFNEVKKTGYTVKYTDVSSSYWAYTDIAFAKNIGWLNGYADGTFKGDKNITRAEVVTVTNHATGRTPDEDFITKNVTTLNRFTDLKNNSHWAYNDIMEAANTHKAVTHKDSETWVK